jgi:DNA-binding transcriptional MerR regulator
MKIATLAKLVNVSGDTLRRWTSTYEPFLTPGATPPKGKTRLLSDHDIRVLLLVATLRDAGQDPEEIVARLETEQKNDWASLPEIPSEWGYATQNMPVAEAASRAYDLAQVAVLQTQVRTLEQRNQEISTGLEQAQQRVADLEQALKEMREQRDLTEAELREQRHQIELELLQARAQVARLEGQLSSYSLGREKPLNVGLLLSSAILFGMVVVIVVFIVATLLR